MFKNRLFDLFRVFVRHTLSTLILKGGGHKLDSGKHVKVDSQDVFNCKFVVKGNIVLNDLFLNLSKHDIHCHRYVLY